jgi:RHS repeat-associated protein
MTVGSETTTYTLDFAAPLVQVLTANGDEESTAYLYGATRIGEYDDAWRYHLLDHLGSVRSLVDADGTVVGTQTYRPYGELLSSAGTASSIYGFTGEQTDLTGLIYLRARMYSPYQSRFLTLDPWDGDGHRSLTLNSYLYALGNPISLSDPTGMWACVWWPWPGLFDVCGTEECEAWLENAFVTIEGTGEVGRNFMRWFQTYDNVWNVLFIIKLGTAAGGRVISHRSIGLFIADKDRMVGGDLGALVHEISHLFQSGGLPEGTVHNEVLARVVTLELKKELFSAGVPESEPWHSEEYMEREKIDPWNEQHLRQVWEDVFGKDPAMPLGLGGSQEQSRNWLELLGINWPYITSNP